MGRYPLILLLAVALLLAWNVYRDGPEKVFGGLFGLFHEPQYGEADRPTRTGNLADRVLEQDAAVARDD